MNRRAAVVSRGQTLVAKRLPSFDPPTIIIPIFLYQGVGIMEYF
jgi:hypothetical protein